MVPLDLRQLFLEHPVLRETDLGELRNEIDDIDPQQFSRWLSSKELIKKLLDLKVLKKTRFDFEGNYRSEVRYLYGEPAEAKVALSLAPKGYVSHYTAMAMHGLTAQVPKNIYVSVEQSAKPKSNQRLTQQAVDTAFAKPQRKTKLITTFNGQRITIVNSAYSGNLGITTDDDGINISNLERTLIDCVVRPNYAGGVQQVAQAFAEAADRVSVREITTILRALNYTYPYHQAIGFYLQRSGAYSKSDVNLFRKQLMDIDFYLAHNLPNKVYVPEWKLFVPQGMHDLQ
ncbi:MAG: type IV toxin-antitoxin system AbiEi family antitoxin [Planctomycetota bacterium]